MTVRVAINGPGRIGRATMGTLLEPSDHFELVAVNDLTPVDNLAYLLRNDTVYGARAGTRQMVRCARQLVGRPEGTGR